MKIALVTVNIGGIDKVKEPVKQNTAYDYFIYDEGNLPFPLPNLNDRLKSKYIKIQTHRFLPHYDVYIYIDGRVEVIKETFIEEFIQQLQDKDVVVLKHKDRSNVFEEMDFIIEHIDKRTPYLSSRYDNQQMEKELKFYKDNDELMTGTFLYASGIFARWNDDKINDCFDEWWRRTVEFSYFDQSMLVYSLAKHQLNICALDWNDVMGNTLALGKHVKTSITLSYEDVFNDIKDHLERKSAFAVLRYGDGEAMMLDTDLGESADYKAHVFKRQLGDTVNEDEKKEIITNLSLAYNKADIIGVATPRHHRKGGYWEKAIPILSKALKTNKEYCSIDIHFDFLNNKVFDKLLANRKRLFYVNSNNLDQRFKERYNIEEVYSYIIPGEMKFSPEYNGIRHYPDHFNKVKEWIDSVGCRGELCLVGGGVVGKMYCIWFKERGGIAVDVGSVFDNWSGKVTRGVDRGAGVTDDTHKL